MALTRGIPSPYNRSAFRGDLVSGLTVGVMLIPQAMAYAVLAGVPPVYGLYASLLPLAIYALVGSSRQVAVGVVAIDSLIVFAAITPIADRGTEAFIQAAIVLAALTGIIQLILGLARFGFLVALLSRPVISGFASAAAITIGLSQVPGLIGVDLDGLPTLWYMLANVNELLGNAHLVSGLIGFGAIGLLLLSKRFLPKFPSALFAVIAGILVVWQLRLDLIGVPIAAEIPSGFPTPQIPEAPLALVQELLPTAIALALVQFTTLVSLGKTFARKHAYRIDASRELLAVGAMNVVGALFRSIPVSGSFSRSAVADAAGARSSLSNLFAMGVIAITLLVLTPAFYFLPIPVFSAIIMVAAFGMVDWAEMRALLHSKRVDGWIAIATFVVTLLVGIQEGILAGVAASIVAIMYRISRPDMVELGQLGDAPLYRELERWDETARVEGLYILRIDASFSFANADFIRDRILRYLDAHPDTRALLVDATSINDLDMTAAEVLGEIAEALETRGVRFSMAGVHGRVTDVVRAAGTEEEVGMDNFYVSVHHAVEDIQRSWAAN